MILTLDVKARHETKYGEYLELEKVSLMYNGGAYCFMRFFDKDGHIKYEWDNSFYGLWLWLIQYDYLTQNPNETYSIPAVKDGYTFWLTKDKQGFRFKCMEATRYNLDDFLIVYKDVQKFIDFLAHTLEARVNDRN